MRLDLRNYRPYPVNGKIGVVNIKTGEVQPNAIVQQYLKQLTNDTGFSKANNDAVHSKSYHDFYRLGRITMSNLHRNMTSIQQVWIVDWLTNNMRASTNKLKCTYTELQKQLNVSRLSIAKTYKILRNMGLAKFRRGHVFINPVLLMRGSDSRYIKIYNDYYFSNQDWWKHLDTNDEFSNE